MVSNIFLAYRFFYFLMLELPEKLLNFLTKVSSVIMKLMKTRCSTMKIILGVDNESHCQANSFYNVFK